MLSCLIISFFGNVNVCKYCVYLFQKWDIAFCFYSLLFHLLLCSFKSIDGAIYSSPFAIQVCKLNRVFGVVGLGIFFFACIIKQDVNVSKQYAKLPAKNVFISLTHFSLLWVFSSLVFAAVFFPSIAFRYSSPRLQTSGISQRLRLLIVK